VLSLIVLSLPPGKIPFEVKINNNSIKTSIIRMIKTRRMRWAGHVARMGAKRNAYRILVGNPEGKRSLGDQGVGGWTILN
jgi:hypothetical protein